MAPRKKVDGEVVPVKKVTKPTEEVLPTEKKYRYQFKSWDEYHAYKGPKG